MRPYKKIAEQMAADSGYTNKGRAKAYVRGFEAAFDFLADMERSGKVSISFNL